MTDFALRDPATFSVEAAAAGDGRTRSVQVKVMDDNGDYQNVGPAVQLKTANVKKEFFLTTPHSAPGQTRLTRGPEAAAPVVRPYDEWKCNNNSHVEVVFAAAGDIPVCYMRRIESVQVEPAKIHWFQFDREEKEFGLDFHFKTEEEDFGIVLTNASAVTQGKSASPFTSGTNILHLCIARL